MISIKKLAPGRLSRAILTLAGRRGNRPIRSLNSAGTVTFQSNVPVDVRDNCAELATLNRRITITVETERLLKLRQTQNQSDDSKGGQS